MTPSCVVDHSTFYHKSSRCSMPGAAWRPRAGNPRRVSARRLRRAHGRPCPRAAPVRAYADGARRRPVHRRRTTHRSCRPLRPHVHRLAHHCRTPCPVRRSMMVAAVVVMPPVRPSIVRRPRPRDHRRRRRGRNVVDDRRAYVRRPCHRGDVCRGRISRIRHVGRPRRVARLVHPVHASRHQQSRRQCRGENGHAVRLHRTTSQTRL